MCEVLESFECTGLECAWLSCSPDLRCHVLAQGMGFAASVWGRDRNLQSPLVVRTAARNDNQACRETESASTFQAVKMEGLNIPCTQVFCLPQTRPRAG